ncbi:2OG-Fe(II) oxygenase [Gluconacetobacter tumulisoli]|uniref:2OG-Fe(II) oxygenase n=1 Tax=Gluconacetobacter tumulisoli TaxID=1286189 RepID=A0A7W4PKK7_9PROT|nr:2OG-Fe(II) oxygenase [Gluconacetobacter tumulisoli]MBB2200963.1 2OG-Fe(II) oxygenase [Gluconacetobacter tumulisoli]
MGPTISGDTPSITGSLPPFTVRALGLKESAERLRGRYQSAHPFPHLIIDDLFPENWLLPILDAYRHRSDWQWQCYDTALQKKTATVPNSDLPSHVQRYFDFVYSGPFLRLLTSLTGIENLLPDPSLFGGGMHVVSGGGHFDLHIDFQKHPQTSLTNRLAMLTYLNPDWDTQNGGNLELWTVRPSARAVEIAPHFGRTVLMEQSKIAAHGHPTHIKPGLERKALIAYFYTNDATADMKSTTVYVSRPGQSASARLQIALHNTLPTPIVRLLQKVRRRVRARMTHRSRGR